MKEVAIDAGYFERAAQWHDVERRLRRGEEFEWPPPLSTPQRRRSERFLRLLPLVRGALLIAIGILIGHILWR
jgi:hypothetical protein